MADPPEELFHELSFYALGLADAGFTHQHVVDAWAAQTANTDTKPIKLTFALVGLYLHVERGFTGKAVQLAHLALARHKRTWPAFPLPQHRGDITIKDVLDAPPGPERNEMIHQWAASVWQAFIESKPSIEALVEEYRVG